MVETIAETPRLRLRTWVESDVDVFFTHLNSHSVMQYLGGPQSREAYHAAYQRAVASQSAYGHCFWIIERLSDGRVLGFCGIKRCNSDGAPMQGAHEIGWRLREDAWGAGYAREAAEATLNIAFGKLNTPTIFAITCKPNAGSWGLMQRIGMRRAPELDFIDIQMPSDIANTTIVYRIDAEDWTQ